MAVIKYLDENGDIQTLGVVTTDLAAYAKVTYVTNLLENYVTWDDVATESKAGLMSAEDKTTLDNLSGGGTTDLETLTIGAVTYDGTKAVSAQNATTTTAGLMSASDKAKLDSIDESVNVVWDSDFDPANWQVLTYSEASGVWQATTIEGDVAFTQDESTNERTITIGDDAWLKKPLWSEDFNSATSIEYTQNPETVEDLKLKKLRVCIEESAIQGFSAKDSFSFSNSENQTEFALPIYDPAYPTDSWYASSFKVFFEVRFKRVWNNTEDDYVTRPYCEAWGEFFSGISNTTWRIPLYRDTSFLSPDVDSAPFGDYVDSFLIYLNGGVSLAGGTITVWGEEVSEE